MSREEAIEVIKAYRDNLTNSTSNQLDGDIKAFEMAIQALSQEPCDDAISRKKAICVISACDGKSAQIEALERLPSVTQKSGKWIEDEYGNVICSGCKRFRRDCRYGHTNYCNHCGAKMVEPKESEDKK